MAVDYLRYMPAMRSAYLERFAGSPGSLTLFVRAEYLDSSLVDPRSTRQETRSGILATILKRRYSVLSLPEPLWIVELPFVTLAAVLARSRAILSRRKLSIVTYAIENSRTELLLGLPTWVPAPIRRFAVSLAVAPYSAVLDRLAFGTDGARANYVEGLPIVGRRIGRKSRTFQPLAPPCPCRLDVEKKPNSVLFLGPLEERKGLDRILQGWPQVIRAVPTANLTICGDGPLRSVVERVAMDYPSVRHIVTKDRGEMHALLASSRVLVSLPRQTRRWREQIGLSLTEGLSHDCHIVTTDQTGIAAWLAKHAQTVVVEAGADSAAAAITRAIEESRGGAVDALPDTSGRAVAERWMYGGRTGEESEWPHRKKTSQ